MAATTTGCHDELVQLLHHRDGRPPGPLTRSDLVQLYRWPGPSGSRCVRSNFVSTLDGSVQGLDGHSGSINTASDHEVFALQRALADVIMAGAGTVREEGYRAVDLEPWQRSLREAEGLAPYPTLAVVSGSLHLDPELAAPPYEHGPVIVATGASASEERAERLTAAGAEILRSPTDRPTVRWLVEALGARGLGRVLCEGGPTLHRDLIADGLLDELSLTLAPSAVGGVGHRSTAGDALAERADFDLELVLLGDDQTIFTSYRRR